MTGRASRSLRPVRALALAAATALIPPTVQPAADWSLRPLTDGTAPSRTPAWSPDGQQIAFDAEVNGLWALHVVDVASGATSPVAIEGQNGRFPAWSPDGRQLAYVGGVTRTRLLTWEFATRRARAIADLPGPASFPSWSPDGRAIAVTVQRDDEFRTWSVSTDGGAAKPLPIASGRDVWPRFSPNGTRLAFFSRRAPHADDDETYIADMVTSKVTRVTARSGHDFCPAWHPSGARLAVVSVMPDATQAIRVLDLDGRLVATPVAGFARATEPSWSPGGERLVFAGVEREGQRYPLVRRVRSPTLRCGGCPDARECPHPPRDTTRQRTPRVLPAAA